MSQRRSLELILDNATEKEAKYDWPSAAEYYENALDLALELNNFQKAGEINELIGYSYYRAAMQGESLKEFEKRIQLATRAYEKAAELFERCKNTEMRAKVNQSKAMAAYVNFWTERDSMKKKRISDECWRLQREALEIYEKMGHSVKIGKTCNSLMKCLINRLEIEWDGIPREKIIEEALEFGETAIKIFSRISDMHQLAQAYHLAGFFCRNGAYARGFTGERREECRQKALAYHQQAVEISENVGDSYILGRACYSLARTQEDLITALALEKHYYEKALQHGILTKDNLLIADALWGLEFATMSAAAGLEDPDKAREEYAKLDEYCNRAIRHYNLVDNPLGVAMSYAEKIASMEQRIRLETDLETRCLSLKEFVKLGYNGLEYAKHSGAMEAIFFSLVALSRALVCSAGVEINATRKRRLLEESSNYIERSIDILKQASGLSRVEPREANLGECLHSLAMNQVEIANIEENIDEKIRILRNAVASAQNGISQALRWAIGPQAVIGKPLWFTIGEKFCFLAKTLNQLHMLTHDTAYLVEVTQTLEQAIEVYNKAHCHSRVAESYWELGKAQEKMANHTESERSFQTASQNYRRSAKSLPALQDFYLDHADYMTAWSEIEKARHHHSEEKYGQAQEHYHKAAVLHESSKLWRYLAPNYSAWARLESGEDLSRKDQSQEAIKTFEEAAELFHEAKQSMEKKLDSLQNVDEKEMVIELTRSSSLRREYCFGRIAVEEAKMFDRKGDHALSSKRYGLAANTFRKLSEAMEYEQDQKELRPIIYLCEAWQKMTLAEAEVSPHLYMDAAEFFEKAKEYSINEKARLLALANSCFCRALESGAKFETTRVHTLYTNATRHLESASSYYLRAGFKGASEYAKATQRLLDAYLYMDDAKKERDTEKKLKYYTMAEKVLEKSVSSYLQAKHPEKSDMVQSLLEEVREERQLAVSLIRILHAPPIVGTTAIFSTPASSHEEAVGLGRFEHADVQTNLIISPREINVGEDVGLEIELVNAGKCPASLIKVENIIPEGFELRKKPEMYRVEDKCLNMKGKRLDPLKTEDVKLVLKPTSKGTFLLKPRTIYADEAGKHKSHEPEPVDITVKELGIKRWILGPS